MTYGHLQQPNKPIVCSNVDYS